MNKKTNDNLTKQQIAELDKEAYSEECKKWQEEQDMENM